MLLHQWLPLVPLDDADASLQHEEEPSSEPHHFKESLSEVIGLAAQSLQIPGLKEPTAGEDVQLGRICIEGHPDWLFMVAATQDLNFL